ncbi:hypothetical protein E1281_17865 [Actinomadura sp. KC345]|uniref:hypothetical protein n=1 Tax=Actinomadura sp. KC345 TaxID=2530371 RepID=UPI0010455DE9|nr:hypothetical protein [Actinomadura sp. KC345]TDC53325.1 hypothetical protein E1281_17865 [Actinomadura sp. KC345]
MPRWLVPACAIAALVVGVAAFALTIRQERTGQAVPAPTVSVTTTVTATMTAAPKPRPTATRTVTVNRYPMCGGEIGQPPELGGMTQEQALAAERAGGCVWHP